jgi:hypothetical protein
MLYIYFNIDTINDSKDHIKKVKKKGKYIPVTGCGGPQGCEK